MVNPYPPRWTWKIRLSRYFGFWIQRLNDRDFDFYHFGWVEIIHYKRGESR